MILAGETLKQILWMKFLTVKLHGGTRAMLVVQWGFLHELRSMETFGTYILLTSYIYVEKKAAATEQLSSIAQVYIYIYILCISISLCLSLYIYIYIYI
jgi:hypothetical protein